MALGTLTLSLRVQRHAIAVKSCCSESVLVKRQFFLTIIPPIYRMPPPSWPNVSALWASSEWCNKAGDG